MKITDIIAESKSVNEAPVGMLKRAGLNVASKLGNTRAAGSLDTAKKANELKKAYDRFLGQSRQKPNSDNILAFLKQNQLPTKSAEAAIQQAASSAGVQLKPAQDMNTSLGIGNKSGEPMAVPNKKDPAPGEVPQSQTDASAGSDNFDIPAYKRKGLADPKFLTPQQALKGKLKAGKGLGQSTGSGFGSAVKAGQAKGLNMSHVPGGNTIMEVELKSSTIDKIILAAVADAVKAGMGQQLDAVTSGGGAAPAPTGSNTSATGGSDSEAPGAFSRFVQGVKQGASGGAAKPGAADSTAQKKGTLNFNQLQKFFPEVDQMKLKQSLTSVLAGRQLNREQLMVLGQVMGELVKKDPQTTLQIMNLLKKVQA